MVCPFKALKQKIYKKALKVPQKPSADKILRIFLDKTIYI